MLVEEGLQRYLQPTLASSMAELRKSMMPILAAEPASGNSSKPSSAAVFTCQPRHTAPVSLYCTYPIVLQAIAGSLLSSPSSQPESALLPCASASRPGDSQEIRTR